VAKLVDAQDLIFKLSARGETLGAKPLKFGEAFTGNPEPSRKRFRIDSEGVETRRAGPKAKTSVVIAMVKG